MPSWQGMPMTKVEVLIGKRRLVALVDDNMVLTKMTLHKGRQHTSSALSISVAIMQQCLCCQKLIIFCIGQWSFYSKLHLALTSLKFNTNQGKNAECMGLRWLEIHLTWYNTNSIVSAAPDLKLICFEFSMFRNVPQISFSIPWAISSFNIFLYYLHHQLVVEGQNML